MSTLGASYRINESEVIAESVGGELLIINLRDGTYYSSDGTGDQIWALLAAHASLSDIAAWLSARYGADMSEVQKAVLSFADELEREGLVVPHLGSDLPVTLPEAPDGATFKAPMLHKYTDFQDLLRLDPIHEVDPSAGWPNVRPAG